ncbi:hypothetical protein AVEN_55769-1 [Araneus ventricosus]|uniref:Uncharacterized protein n=1 Tax=Araneus ventricosus TaxID=182803 RepID=A0A4Y2EYU3_ARAVE|nr:hypothetical protein AVEN_55769-1 [Araneus ventricosus]
MLYYLDPNVNFKSLFVRKKNREDSNHREGVVQIIYQHVFANRSPVATNSSQLATQLLANRQTRKCTSAFKRDIHEDTVPLHLERLVPNPVVNANIRRELDCRGRKVWKSNLVRFPFGAFGHKTEIRSPRRGASLSHKSENYPWGTGRVGGSQGGESIPGGPVLEAEGGVGAVALGIRVPVGVGTVRSVNDPPKWMAWKLDRLLAPNRLKSSSRERPALGCTFTSAPLHTNSAAPRQNQSSA